jgi:hypothetical protein
LVNATIWKGHCHYEMFCIYQPPNAHVRISGTLSSNAMAAVAVKKIYCCVFAYICNWPCDNLFCQICYW